MALRRSLQQSLQQLRDSYRQLPTGIHNDALCYSTCRSEPCSEHCSTSGNAHVAVSESTYRGSSPTGAAALQAAWPRSPGLCPHLAAGSKRCIYSQSAWCGTLSRQRLPSLSDGLRSSRVLSRQQPPALCRAPRSFAAGPAAVPQLATYSVTVVTGTQRYTHSPCTFCHPDIAGLSVDYVCLGNWRQREEIAWRICFTQAAIVQFFRHWV